MVPRGLFKFGAAWIWRGKPRPCRGVFFFFQKWHKANVEYLCNNFGGVAVPTAWVGGSGCLLSWKKIDFPPKSWESKLCCKCLPSTFRPGLLCDCEAAWHGVWVVGVFHCFGFLRNRPRFVTFGPFLTIYIPSVWNLLNVPILDISPICVHRHFGRSQFSLFFSFLFLAPPPRCDGRSTMNDVFQVSQMPSHSTNK